MSFPDMIQIQPSAGQGSMDQLGAAYNLLASKLDDADKALGKKQDVFPVSYPTDFDTRLSNLIDSVPLA